MGLLARGQQMINRNLKAAAGVAVTYTRTVNGVTKTATLTARIGNTLFTGLAEQPVAVQRGQRDYLIEVADLKFSAVATTPDRGDRVTDGTQVWEVASPDPNEPAWRYSDNTRTVYRVHTRRVNA